MAPAATHSRPDGRLRCRGGGQLGSRLEQAPAARPGGQGRRRSRFLRHEGRRPPARQAWSRAAAVGGSPPEVLGPERAVTPRRPRSERGRPRHAARPTRGPLGGCQDRVLPPGPFRGPAAWAVRLFSSLKPLCLHHLQTKRPGRSPARR